MPIKNIIPFILAFAFFSSCVNTTLIQKSNASNHVIEKYYVLKKDNSVKSGKYEQYYKGKIITEGFYVNNQKHGNWNYYDYSNNLVIKGSYKNGLYINSWNTLLNGEKTGTIVYNDTSMNVIGYHSNKKISYIIFDYRKSNGYCKSYHKNGTLKEIAYLKNGKMDSLYSVYFDNGKLHREIIFKEGVVSKILKTYDPLGNEMNGGNCVNGNGSFIRYYIPEDTQTGKFAIESISEFSNGHYNNDFVRYFDDGTIESKGKYLNGKKVGIWQIHDFMNKSLVARNFEILPDKEYDENAKPNLNICILGDDEYNRAPEFQGGEKELYQFLSENIVYPAGARAKGIEDRVIFEIFLNDLGEIADIKAISYKEEVFVHAGKNVIKSFPRWNPRLQMGIPVPSKLTLPIRFNLN